jgi:hypothetical protein
MDEKDKEHFMSLTPSERIIFVLKSLEDFDGPQSGELLCRYLGMKRKNLDSLLSRMYQRGKIERVSPGIYRCHGDQRKPRF